MTSTFIFEQKVTEKNLKYAQFYRNTVFALDVRYRIRYRTIKFPIFKKDRISKLEIG